jgi:hypothetical protein
VDAPCTTAESRAVRYVGNRPNRKFDDLCLVSQQKRHGILHKGVGTSGFGRAAGDPDARRLIYG